MSSILAMRAQELGGLILVFAGDRPDFGIDGRAVSSLKGFVPP